MPKALADLTTLRLGGPAERLVEAHDEAAVVAAVRAADTAGEPLLIVAGGSNLVVADAGFPGTVLRIATRGIEGGTVAAGEPWDPFVARCVAAGLAGVECLSGIPGSIGATPIQNVGAYGQEVADVIVSVRAFDRHADAVQEIPAAECGFAYRSSAFKRDPGRWVVLAVTFELPRQERSMPIRYAELARALGVPEGGTAPLAAVREAVLALRRRKGMVVDPGDPDSVSAGSFFTNPVLTPEAFAALEARIANGSRPPRFPQPDGSVKTSAAWLIEHAGFRRGHGDPATIAISSKHTLALTNRGAGTTTELVALAREIADGVRERFGVELEPEPVFAGHAWRS
jgi:UDP-N-acetylmuramate dehydrogenase